MLQIPPITAEYQTPPPNLFIAEVKGLAMFVVINEDGKYYTNDLRKFDGDQPFLWSSHKQLAKQYAKRGWAERVAEKVEGKPLQWTWKQPRW